MLTYSQLFLLIDALSKGLNHGEGELVLAHIQILEALVAAQISEQGS